MLVQGRHFTRPQQSLACANSGHVLLLENVEHACFSHQLGQVLWQAVTYGEGSLGMYVSCKEVQSTGQVYLER